MRAASSSEPSHHTICSGRVIRATDSTHCSSGVDTKPPKEIVSAYRRGTQGIKSLRIASGSAETTNLKSLRHACGERKMHRHYRGKGEYPRGSRSRIFRCYTLLRNVCPEVQGRNNCRRRKTALPARLAR